MLWAPLVRSLRPPRPPGRSGFFPGVERTDHPWRLPQRLAYAQCPPGSGLVSGSGLTSRSNRPYNRRTAGGGNKLGFYLHLSTDQAGLWEAIRRVQPPVLLIHADTANTMLLEEIRRFRRRRPL